MVDWLLKKHPTLGTPLGPVVFVVMDGVGIGPNDAGNAVIHADTPTLDQLKSTSLYTELKAHGTAVGLPSDKDMGNSEVGHNALGAGRIIVQGAKLVDQAIQSGSMFESQVWQETVATQTLHFIGLLSDGNVHSHEKHLHAMLRQARKDGVKSARIHILLDGRDVPENSALVYVNRLEAVLSELGDDYKIASGGGRMLVTMDRYEADWSMVERGWNTHVQGKARSFDSAQQAIETLREENPDAGDQFLPPFTVRPATPIQDGDGVIFFNFRGDRAIEISRAFEEEGFQAFDRGDRPNCLYAGMMEYDGDSHIPNRYLVNPPSIEQTSGEYLARNGVTQWACSETQKFGHVTYFWNGNRSGKFDDKLEHYVQIESDRIRFDQAPRMKAKEITDAAIDAIQSGDWRLLRLNYANGDMVGHTGNLSAAIEAMSFVDQQIARLVHVVKKANGILVITADHGNCDEMFLHDKQGGFKLTAEGERLSCTSHTLNKVPCYIVGAPKNITLKHGGGLANLAATTMNLLGYDAPFDCEKSLFSAG